jgi:hypothetical protein|tara:strand:+ start:1132 stop:1509 length:378 start_codon:yes stop_codon:yes gene_type:complete
MKPRNSISEERQQARQKVVEKMKKRAEYYRAKNAKKMSPRQSLYWVIQKLGPVPVTKRDDNLSYEETRLREAVEVLMDYVSVDTLNEEHMEAGPDWKFDDSYEEPEFVEDEDYKRRRKTDNPKLG